MTKSKMFLISGVMALWSLLLTATTVVLGAAPLRGLRLLAGGFSYWSVLVLMTGTLLWMDRLVVAVALLTLGMVVGLFSEAEERDHDLVAAGFLSVLTTTLFGAGAVAFWISKKGTGWYTELLNKAEHFLTLVPGWNETVGIQAKDILAQTPSLFVIALILGLYFSLLFENKVAQMAGIRLKRRLKMRDFAVPDEFIWLFLISLAGAFLNSSAPWVEIASVNILNVCVAIFFLQGLAVIASYFEMYKVGMMWQIVLFALFVTQLFIVVSVVGLVDYWLNLREKMKSKAQELDQGISKK